MSLTIDFNIRRDSKISYEICRMGSYGLMAERDLRAMSDEDYTRFKNYLVKSLQAHGMPLAAEKHLAKSQFFAYRIKVDGVVIPLSPTVSLKSYMTMHDTPVPQEINDLLCAVATGKTPAAKKTTTPSVSASVF